MEVTRRTVLKGAGTVAGLHALSPLFVNAAWGDGDPQWATRRRLIVIDLNGGNDGLNMVVPRTGAKRDVYAQVRPTIALPTESLLPLDRGGPDDGSLGLHPSLATLHQLYEADRLAIVQGVDYPNHNYSHFTSDDIWQAGNPNNIGDAGWLGRHLDRTGVAAGELRAVGIGGRLPHALRGVTFSGAQVNSLADTHFSDGTTAVAEARHAVYGRYVQHTAGEPDRQYYGELCAGVVTLDQDTRGLTAAQPGGVANQLLTARALLGADLGVEVVFVTTYGYDTHASQSQLHATLLTDLDQAIEAFYFGTRGGTAVLDSAGNPIGAVPASLAAQTLIMTFSEFGRRIGENASGTDHGAAAPMLLVGPPPPAAGSGAPKLMPGLHRDHPDLGTTALPADNLGMTTDLRSVYQSVLVNWIDDPSGPSPDEGDGQFVLSGTGLDTDGTIIGLFGTA